MVIKTRAWWCLLLVSVLVVHSAVEDLEPEKEKAVFTSDTHGVLPPGTSTLRHVDYVDAGKCRFSCHEEPLCSAYRYTHSTSECTLLQAPSHLVSASENNAWHLAAAKMTGIPYVQDPVTLERLKMVESLAAATKEDTRRGKLSFDDNIKEEIAAINQDKQNKIKASSSSSTMKEAILVAKFAKAEVKKYVAAHREKYESDLVHQVEFMSTEKAKAKMRSPKGVKKLEKEKFKDVNSKVIKLAKTMKVAVKGSVARKLTREFRRDLNKVVLAKTTQFTEEILKQKELKQAAAMADAKAKAAADKASKTANKMQEQADQDKSKIAQHAANELVKKKHDKESKKKDDKAVKELEKKQEKKSKAKKMSRKKSQDKESKKSKDKKSKKSKDKKSKKSKDKKMSTVPAARLLG